MRVVVLGSYVHAHCLAVTTLPLSGASVQASACWQGHGGKGLNLAVGLHRLGLEVSLLLAVGRDAAGVSVHNFLQEEGIATKYIFSLGEQSGFGVGLVGADGQNVIAVYSGANHLLDQSHIAALEEDISQAQLICAQFEIQQSVILTAFQLAKQHQLKTVLNPSPWQRPSVELLKLTDILILNEIEALSMFELDDVLNLSIEAWCNLKLIPYWYGELLVITLAERGAILFSQGQEPLYVPAWSIIQLDPTGSGDAFAVGFMYALLKQNSYSQIMRFANACGALLAQEVGVLNRLPTLNKVEAFIQQNQ